MEKGLKLFLEFAKIICQFIDVSLRRRDIIKKVNFEI
jgi:hypothetical protein